MPAAEPQLRLKGNYFADPEFFRTDVTKGVTRTPAGVRVVALPSDFLLGFRDAVIYECGRSYRSVMKVAGKKWGTQFAKRLEKELTGFYQSPARDLHPTVLRVCLAEAFRAHGYGSLTLEIDEGGSGLIIVDLQDSVMPALVREADRSVDMLMAGMIGAVLSHFTTRTLDCIQTECPSLGADRSRFIVGPAERIAEVEQWADDSESNPGHEVILRRLRQAPETANRGESTAV